MRKVIVSLLFALSLAGCASTTVQREWKDPAYRSRLMHSALVLGLPAGYETGRGCMNEFVRQLGERAVSARPAYGSSAPPAITRAATIAKAREAGADVVLVCRFMQKRTQLDVYPGESPSAIMMPDWYMWEGPEYVENQYDVFGTMLYETATGKPVWSAISDTSVSAADKKIMESYVKKMLKRMEEQGLVGPARKK
jgi:hypothetical protein